MQIEQNTENIIQCELSVAWWLACNFVGGGILLVEVAATAWFSRFSSLLSC